MDLDKTKVVVSGPRSSVDSVKYVQATFDANKESVDTKSTELELKALDSEMNEVDHVTLEFNKVTAKVSYFQQKQVKINPIFSSNESNLVSICILCSCNFLIAFFILSSLNRFSILSKNLLITSLLFLHNI